MRHTLFIALITFASAASAFGPDLDAARNRQIQSRFSSADANADGKLTLQEAEGRLPVVAANFDAIDTGKVGYVTLEQVQDYVRNQKPSSGTGPLSRR